jgi:DNA polymerase elongation subunit (family B)
MAKTLTGWLFDLYPVKEGMALWIIARGSGERLMLVHPYKPYFFVSGPAGAVARALAPLRGLVEISHTERTEFYSGRSMRVTRVCAPPLLFHEAVRSFAGRLELFTCDIPIAQLYLYDTGLFPLGLCEVEHDDEGRILSVSSLDSPLDIRYALPPCGACPFPLKKPL